MLTQNIPFEKIYDKFAMRIVFQSTRPKEKLMALKIYSIVTDHFTPNPTRLRDWISAPKSNGYEALHITVMGPQNKWIEIQIRSERMHEIAEKATLPIINTNKVIKKTSGLKAGSTACRKYWRTIQEMLLTL